MAQKNHRKNFDNEFIGKNDKLDDKNDINIEEFATKLGIHPLVLYMWQTQSEDKEIIPSKDEEYPDSYEVDTAQDLLSRYIVHRWKNQYFNLSEPFEINPKIVNAQSLQFELLLLRINRPAYDLYSENSWVIDLLPGYPELGPMVEELRRLKLIDSLTATKIYEKWQKKISTQMNSEEKEEQKKIKKLSMRELCFAILENFEYQKIHLNDTYIASYAKYYHKMNELYFQEVQELTENEKQNFLIKRMLAWGKKFEKTAVEYLSVRAKTISTLIKKAHNFHRELREKFQDLYEFLNTSDIRLALLYHPIKNLVSEMMIYQAMCENKLDSEDRLSEDRVDVGAPSKYMEREFISDLDNYIQENGITFSKYEPSKDKAVWMADFLNLLSNLKDREWHLYGNQYRFPFTNNYTEEKIYKALNLSKYEPK